MVKNPCVFCGFRKVSNLVLPKFRERLYSKLLATITAHLNGIASSSVEIAHDELFVEELIRKWGDHKVVLAKIKGDIMRFSPEINVYNLGNDLWTKNIIMSSQIKTRLLTITSKFVERERRTGEVINRWRMFQIIAMLQLSGTSVYEEFEALFLRESADFYRVEAQNLIECCDCGDYIDKVTKRLDEESKRAWDCNMGSNTKKMITSVVKKEMIEDQMLRLINMENFGLVHMLCNDKYVDLCKMYHLFSRVNVGLSEFREVMTSHIRETGKGLVTGSEMLNDPVEFVNRLLDLKDKYDKIIEVSFKKCTPLQKILTSSFKYFINLNQRSPEYISLFVDDKFRKGRSEEPRLNSSHSGESRMPSSA